MNVEISNKLDKTNWLLEKVERNTAKQGTSGFRDDSNQGATVTSGSSQSVSSQSERYDFGDDADYQGGNSHKTINIGGYKFNLSTTFRDKVVVVRLSPEKGTLEVEEGDILKLKIEELTQEHLGSIPDVKVEPVASISVIVPYTNREDVLTWREQLAELIKEEWDEIVEMRDR